MAIPKTKSELFAASQEQFGILLSLIQDAPDDILNLPGACEDWSIKDILAHLHAWHKMFLRWYTEGMSARNPNIPDKGYTWKDTPALNERIYEEYKAIPFEKILESLEHSHQLVMEKISAHSDEELFTKKYYHWTGSSSLGVYSRGAASSHYDWANKHIKKFLKARS